MFIDEVFITIKIQVKATSEEGPNWIHQGHLHTGSNQIATRHY